MAEWRLLLAATALGLLLSLLVGLVRLWRGPEPADRMLSAQLFGSTGIALLLVLAEWLESPSPRNVALILALLSVVANVAFVSRVWRADRLPPRVASEEEEQA